VTALLQRVCRECGSKVYLRFYFLTWFGFVLTHFGNKIWFCGQIFCMCLGFHCLIFDSVRCENGVTFKMVSYVIFLGFLSEPTNLVRVTGLQMLQRQTPSGSHYMLIVCQCCKEGNIVRVL
jgi:hypothetical protein